MPWSRPCWTSAVAAGGRRPSRSPSATAATRWFRRPPVWLGRRFARGAGRLPATRRRRTASDALAADGPASSRINPASRPRSKRWWIRSRAATRPRRCAGPARVARSWRRALNEQGWRVSSTTVGRLLHRLGYRLQSPRKRQEGATHPDRNAQFEHINQTADEHLTAGQPVILGRHEEEGAGRELQERRAGMAAEGHAAGGAGA